MLIVVCGLSKSGKSSLIKAAVAGGLDVPIVKASQLLCLSGRPIQGLTASDALGNQPELMQLLAECIQENRPTILDGHLLIETLDGPQLVPEAYLIAVGLVGIVAVTAPPQTIALRRLETTFTTDPQEIGDLASIENIQARRMARIANIPYYEVDHLDVSALIKAVTECLRKAGTASR